MTQTAAQFLASTIAAGKTPTAFSFPGYRANIERTKYADETACCAWCGKSATTGAFNAYLTGHSEFTTPTPETDTLNDDLGFYPLGADCAARLRKTVPVFGAASEGYPRT